MVLRAGIILPFQFGDIKKLLMVGSPEEDRELKLYDFTNVVRAAFNIYHFEFRNKKIDFLIPEELLIHYLEQCKDLTNFVIQVDQVSDGNLVQPSHCRILSCSDNQYQSHTYHVAPGQSSNGSSPKRKYNISNGRLSQIKCQSGSDGEDLNIHNNRNVKSRAISHLPMNGEEQECGPPTPKLRVATNLIKQRKERMSKGQKELYVEFLEQNPVVNKHRRNDPLLDIFWLRLANILNSCPNGAAKSVAEWKQAFDNWRYRIYLYARHNSQLNEEDAINSKTFKPLTRTDKRAYNLWIRNPDTAPANTEKLPNDLTSSED